MLKHFQVPSGESNAALTAPSRPTDRWARLIVRSGSCIVAFGKSAFPKGLVALLRSGSGRFSEQIGLIRGLNSEKRTSRKGWLHCCVRDVRFSEQVGLIRGLNSEKRTSRSS